ncbi:VC0807 family protein [Pseudonocardia humida]|uniref:Intracellular septation protein A n=1 Tax=Pseudonocardia humida TaxID=2800819 RepID=A0ABT0ZW12_9PSEU|nr:VC0807 family protein [Pseudonocardia humida]MCO1654858.1 hypothetical protein [Pseudonocardia humida]
MAENRSVPPLVRTLALDVAAPLAVFYGLHAWGVGDVPALLASAVPPLLHAGYTGLRERRVDAIGVAVLAATLLSLLATLLGSGGPRELLARGVWLTAPFGLWTLASAFTRRPLCFTVSRSMMPGRVVVMDRLWETNARFRRAWRDITITWGAVSLTDSALRLVMAYTLPVAWVPALDTALTFVTIAALQPPTWFFLWRAGVWNELFGRRRVAA